MTNEQIKHLLANGIFPENKTARRLVETHISWVILCDQFVYKIKKPVKYSFLDFSTLARRAHFCQREIELNKRLTENIYLDVLPVYENDGRYGIGDGKGTIIDHAVRMHKVDTTKQMDVLLAQDKVTEKDISELAKKIASFHANSISISNKDFLDIQPLFNDLAVQAEFLGKESGGRFREVIDSAINFSDRFIKKHSGRLQERLREGFFRDCHGDLHSRNIFLLSSPQPFDCIEFNDDLRQIDVLNDVAFLCMDLDFSDRQDLSELFMKEYTERFPAIETAEDRSLFIYYKSYRANIRAKINSLRARSAADETEKKKALVTAEKYLEMMDKYLSSVASPE
jgi:aminoglycoside phosphotransferase family enzyme